MKIPKISEVVGRSTKLQLLADFLLISIFPLLLLGLITSVICRNALWNEAVNFSIQSEQLALNDMENLFKSADTLCSTEMNDVSMQRRMRSKFSTLSERYSTDLEGGMDLLSLTTYQPEIFGLYVMGENGGSYKSNIYSFYSGDFRQSSWYQQIISQDGAIWYKAHSGSFAVKTTDESLISVGMPYIDKATGRKNGIILVDIEENALLKIVNRSLGDRGCMLLLDGQNEIINTSSGAGLSGSLRQYVLDRVKSYQATEGEIKDNTAVIQTQKALIVYQTSPLTHWKIIGIVPTAEIYGNIDVIAIVTLILLAVFSAAAVGSSLYLAKKFTDPIRKLQQAMLSVEEGDFSTAIDLNRKDELGQLGASFNQMIKKIRRLMDLVYEKQVMLRKSEYKALEAQINPHFLYNSLDSIMWLLRMNRTEDASVMLSSFTTLFRISLSKGNDFIPIEKEVKHVESYLVVQNMRYSKKFDYEVHVPPDLMKYHTLKLLLQPLVENAIYHGLSVEKSKILISISARQLPGRIIFTVWDDGVGIPPEKLQALQEALNREESDTGGEGKAGYGLRNVNGRIKAYFGKEYGLTVASKYGEGTTVEVVIPKIGAEGGENHVQSHPV